MVRRSALLAAPLTAAAAAGAVMLALVVGGTWAACVVPADPVASGADCFQFDPRTDTDVTLFFQDANLGSSPAPNQYVQLGALSDPASNYPLQDIQVRGCIDRDPHTTGHCTAMLTCP